MVTIVDLFLSGQKFVRRNGRGLGETSTIRFLGHALFLCEIMRRSGHSCNHLSEAWYFKPMELVTCQVTVRISWPN